MVHGLDHEWVAVRPVVAVACQQTNADGIAPSHHAIAVVLDPSIQLARRRRLDGDGRRGSMKPAGADRVRELNEDMAGNIGRGRRLIQPLKAAAPKRLSAKEKGRGAAAFL